MLYVYHGDYSRKNTLMVIKELWAFKTIKSEKKIISQIESLLNASSTTGYSKKIMIDFLKYNYSSFSSNAQDLINPLIE